MRKTIWAALAAAAAIVAAGCGSGSHGNGDADAADVADSGDGDASDAPADTGGEDASVDDAATDADDADGPGDADAADGEDGGDAVEEDAPDPLLTDDDGDGFSEWEGDCDDADAAAYPGATMHREGVDYDCDGRREWLAKMTLVVDDALEMCVNGTVVHSCSTGLCGCCCCEDEYYEQVLESGLNVVGVHGWDTVGVTAGFAMHIEVAGTEIITRGDRPTEPDSSAWRYFPTSAEAPQATWCDQTFDASGWGPAVFASEPGDIMGFNRPEALQRLGGNWIWDGNPVALADSWFRIELMIPDVEPTWDPPAAPACAHGTPVLVSNPPTTAEHRVDNGLDVVWNGSGWVAVYDEYLRPWSWSSPAGGVDDEASRLLAADGTPAGPGVDWNDQGSTTDTNALWWNMWPEAVWTGSTIGVFFEDCRTNRDHDYLYGHLLGPSGAPIGTDVRLDTGANTQGDAAAAWSGSEFGVAWQDDRTGGTEIWFKRVSASMAAIEPAIRVTDAIGFSRVPSIAWSGSEWLVVWEDQRNAGNPEIYFARLDPAGAKAGSDVRLTSSAGQSLEPRIAWTGSTLGIAWHDDGWVNMEIGFMIVDPAGAILEGPVRVTDDGSVSEGVDVVWTGSRFGLAWRDDRTGSGDIYMAQLGPDGAKIGGDERITDTVGPSIQPAIAWSGTAYGIAWKDEEDLSAPNTMDWNLDTWFVAVACP